ncbi:molybdate ABC transporter substrate-binding protein [uncultured Brevundimonas sp.]|uniref:molybdate ABC transporter substrate-binding protein n=1 Tax=uncultured Brevundimonas sp. TaxID=213418 RepID=UPI0030EF5AF3|tara:strand:+ start:4114 stop:4938 length:825 start_codon:yes stop_codon:yes gene_type:complete
MNEAGSGMGRRQWLILLAAGVLSACDSGRSRNGARVDVFAAASLREVIDAAVASYRQLTDLTVRVTYAGSAQLARQIDRGAPADLFISADEAWMDWLDERELIDASGRRDVAANSLVLISPVSSPAASVDLTSGTDLVTRLGEGRLAIAEPAVPAGRYGQEALTAMSLWPAVKDRLAPGDSVRAALALVARGEAPLGVVYATDALAEPRVRVLATFPASSHAPIVYSAAPVQRLDDFGNPAAAVAFLNYLSGNEGQALFRRFGFASPPTGSTSS